jgi:hypothetical protein
MLRREALVRTDVSEERIASTIRVTRIGELGTLAAVFSISSRQVLGPTQLPIHCVPGALSSPVEWPGHKADHSHPTNAEFEKTWICAYTPHSPSLYSA